MSYLGASAAPSGKRSRSPRAGAKRRGASAPRTRARVVPNAWNMHGRTAAPVATTRQRRAWAPGMLRPDAGPVVAIDPQLGLSLKPPKWARKAAKAVGKAVVDVGKVALKVAPVAALVVPGLGPAAAGLLKALPGATTVARAATAMRRIPGATTAGRVIKAARTIKPSATDKGRLVSAVAAGGMLAPLVLKAPQAKAPDAQVSPAAPLALAVPEPAAPMPAQPTAQASPTGQPYFPPGSSAADDAGSDASPAGVAQTGGNHAWIMPAAMIALLLFVAQSHKEG